MTINLPYDTAAGDLGSAGDPPPAIAGFVRALSLRLDLVFVITYAFRKIIPGPKNGL